MSHGTQVDDAQCVYVCLCACVCPVVCVCVCMFVCVNIHIYRDLTQVEDDEAAGKERLGSAA